MKKIISVLLIIVSLSSNIVYSYPLMQTIEPINLIQLNTSIILNILQDLQEPNLDKLEQIPKIETLKKIVDITDVDNNIKKFREQNNPRRNGQNKIETKYFDIYYPQNNQTAEMYGNTLKEYADTVYIFLYMLYGKKQVPAEIHIINEEDSPQNESKIRMDEKVTFVWISPDHTQYLGGAVVEMIHELNHIFFNTLNNKWNVGSDNDPYSFFVVEGVSRIIGPIYQIDAFSNKENFKAHNDANKVEENLLKWKKRSINANYNPTIIQSNELLKISGWGNGDIKYRLSRDQIILFWMYLYDEYGIEKLSQLLINIGNDSNYKEQIEKNYGKKLETLNTEFNNLIK